MPRSKKSSRIENSSGNVFADLALPGSEELNTKLRLCVVINRILDNRELTQAQIGEVLGISQPKVSALRSYKLEGFSVERLMHFATALEHDVLIEVRPRGKARREARILVVNAA